MPQKFQLNNHDRGIENKEIMNSLKMKCEKSLNKLFKMKNEIQAMKDISNSSKELLRRKLFSSNVENNDKESPIIVKVFNNISKKQKDSD